MELQKTESEPESYTTNLKEMADEMAKYHEAIQEKGLITPRPQREVAMITALCDLPKIDDNDKMPLLNQLTYVEIEQALKRSPNMKAPGLNGIPTDLYKKLHQCYLKNTRANKPGLDIVNILKEAYNHIKTSNECEKEFLAGWLCPIYKKKDRHEITNY